MSNGALPQWKREVLQRRAARSRTGVAPPAAPPPPPPPAPADDDEELRYGPGIVNRLKSRYLSLALRDAPRRRPSVLRRAASLEHLLEERPPPVPCARPTTHPRPPRPQSMAVPPVQPAPAQRRDLVKRARSVDALSRLESREDSRATFSSPPPPPPPPIATRPPQPQTRSARTPRRPTPLLRETERPPPDVVRSTLRKFESAPIRRTTPSGRVSAALRDLEGPRTSTPEPRDFAEGPPLSPRTPSPLPPTETVAAVALGPTVVSASGSVSASNGGTTVVLVSAPKSSPTIQDESLQDAEVVRPAIGGARQVSRAALEGIARAGSTVRYVFEAPRAGSHLPPLAATNPVLVGRARRIGVIRPMPARTSDTAEREQSVEDIDEKTPERLASPAAPSSPPPVENDVPPPSRIERKEPPPAALVEPIPRAPPDAPRDATPPHSPPPPLIIERSPSPKTKSKCNTINGGILMNGHSGSERTPEAKGAVSRMAAAGIERAWSGSSEKKLVDAKEKTVTTVPWARATTGDGAASRRPRVPPPSSTSVVFNFSNRKEVPDYIENDGIILRGSRRNRIKVSNISIF